MIHIKNQQEIDKMKRAGQLVFSTIKHLEKMIEPGMTTARLDRAATEFIVKHGGQPSFLNYNGFPKSICTSVNHTVIHGIPCNKKLKQGDLLSIDIGVYYQGFHGDAARSYVVGECDRQIQTLIDVCQRSFCSGLNCAKVGHRLLDISAAIQACVECAEYSVVRDFVGHGIGRELHEDPEVPNFLEGTGRGVRLKTGMALAIEPMICMGSHEVEVASDGWAVNTRDKSLAAHYENTVIVFEDTPIITTLPI